MAKGKTKSGFEFKLSKERLNNYELLEIIDGVEENPLLVPKVLVMLLGKEQSDRLKDHVRNDEGIVPADKIVEEIMDIFNTDGEAKKLLILAGMIRFDENALICDLAETYHIYDYKQLPALQVAVFSAGLRDNSRIKMKLSDQMISLDTTLLAGVLDRLSLLLWSKTKDAEKGRNKPKLVMDSLHNKLKQEKEEIVFNSGEDFEKYRKMLLSGKVGGDENGN